MEGLSIDHVRAGQARAALRDDRGRPLSQAAAARKLDVHPVTLNKIENGKANVSLELLERMSRLYGRSREWLCGENEPADPVEAAREDIAEALGDIGTGLGKLADLVETLNGAAAGRAKAAA